MEDTRYDTIIVGGGIAGLTAAAYLARAGKKILLIEKNSEFGGLVNTFDSDGFRFEAGARALENAGIILPMLKDLGIELDVVRSKVSIGVEDRILMIEDEASIQEYRDFLVGLYPESADEVDAFMRTMRKMMNLLDVLYGIDNPLFKDIKRDKDYLFKTLLPWLPRFLFAVGRINRLNRPYERYLETILNNPSLRDIITQHFFKGTPAFFALSYFSLYLDYFYPKGGVGKLADSLVDSIKANGGGLLPNTCIREINAAQQMVIDEQNRRHTYNKLIWAADLKTLYAITQLDGFSATIQKKVEQMTQQLQQGKGSESIFSLYLQVNLPLSYFSAKAHGHFFYTPCRTGLGQVNRSELQTMLDRWDAVEKAEAFAWLDRFLKLNTFEISIPGLKDSTLVPPGKTGVIVSFLVEYELFEKLQQKGWYEEFRNAIEEQLIDILNASVYPELKPQVEKHFSFTPVSIKQRIGSTDGAVVGWSFEAQVPTVQRIEKAAESVKTPIPSIFQAGQWVYTPAGVPMSILTGKLAADACIKNNKNR